MKKILLILLLGIGSVECMAQGLLKKDSLLKLLPETKDDTVKVLLLVNLVKATKNTDIAAAYKYCAEALNLSKKLNYYKGRFLALINEISLIRIEGKDSLALEKCKSFVELAESLKDSFNIAAGYLNLGEVYDNNGNNEKAVEYCLKGLGIAERLNQKSLLQDAYAALQRIYFSRSEFDKAIIYGEKAIAVANELHDKNRIMSQSYNLAYTYNITKQFDKSVSLSNEVIKIAKELGDQRVESYALYNLCSIGLRNGKLQEALTYGKQCLEIAHKTTDKSIESNVLAALGSINLQLGKNKDAENYMLQALDLRTKTEDKQGVAEIKNMLASVYYAMGNPVKAYNLEKESEDFMDAYNQSILAKQSSDLEKKYETQKKETQIRLQQAQLKQKNILNYILIGSALVLSIISLLSYYIYRNRQKLQQAKIDELESEKQLTATEAVLKGEEQERTRLAKDLHDGLGGMLSGIKYSLSNMKENLIMTPANAQAFERSIDMLDSSIKEMRRVAHNMMPEMLVKYGLNIALKEYCAEINNSGVVQVNYQPIGMEGVNFEQTVALTIYRIVQELLNNTIKHAAAQNILVQPHVSDENKFLSLTVEDDGNGFDMALLKNAKGIGWANIQNRVGFLKGTIDIKSSPGNGTSILIEINI